MKNQNSSNSGEVLYCISEKAYLTWEDLWIKLNAFIVTCSAVAHLPISLESEPFIHSTCEELAASCSTQIYEDWISFLSEMTPEKIKCVKIK